MNVTDKPVKTEDIEVAELRISEKNIKRTDKSNRNKRRHALIREHTGKQHLKLEQHKVS